jgi:hypothetical protein
MTFQEAVAKGEETGIGFRRRSWPKKQKFVYTYDNQVMDARYTRPTQLSRMLSDPRRDEIETLMRASWAPYVSDVLANDWELVMPVRKVRRRGPAHGGSQVQD